MGTWKFWRLVILLALLAGLGWTLIYRSPIGRSLAEHAAIKTPYQTEREWAIRESAIDIEKMAAFADRREAKPLPQTLPDIPWEPDAFVTLASAALGQVPATTSFQLDLHPSLIAMQVSGFVEANTAVSQALNTDMRDARAHGSAAFLLGAFALRDAADQFTDVRWALNRMTAHLAVARALRRDGATSPDGALAGVLLSALANQRSRAATQLAALGAGTPPEPLNAWLRALQIRLNDDWRVLPEPSAASRLEKLEYFRARRAVVHRRRVVDDLSVLGEELAVDFRRLAQDGQVGVQDGRNIIPDALDEELDEARLVYRNLNGKEMPEALDEALNHRATYLVTDRPSVLPWGAWAEFYQRHIAMNIGMVDSHYRYMLGDPEGADQSKSELDRRLGMLTMFPLGTLRRTKGRQATEADMTYVDDVVSISESAPELITERAWVFFEAGSRAESIRKSMTKASAWFAPSTARMPYEAGARNTEGIRAKAEDLPALLEAASTDRLLLISAAGVGHGAATDRARELLRQREDFDLGATDLALKSAKDDATRAALQRKACTLTSADCLLLAATLVKLGETDEAVTMYERGLSDPLIDMLVYSSQAGWLVDYYRQHLRIPDAMAIADKAAGVNDIAGPATRGRLREKTGDMTGAEQDFAGIATNYKDLEYLLGFYYRRVEVAHDEAYRNKWNRWLAELFPRGLQPVPASMPEKPKNGVFVYQDSELSRRAGIRSGDIIVGLEGWQVENFEQYRAINRFFEQPHMKLTIWRGQLITIEADAPNRLFGMDIKTHPLKGWIE